MMRRNQEEPRGIRGVGVNTVKHYTIGPKKKSPRAGLELTSTVTISQHPEKHTTNLAKMIAGCRCIIGSHALPKVQTGLHLVTFQKPLLILT